MRWHKPMLLILQVILLILLVACGSQPAVVDDPPVTPIETPAPETPVPQTPAEPPAAAEPDEVENLAEIFAERKQFEGLVFEYVYILGNELELKGKMWITDEKMKQEMQVEGEHFTQIVDFELGIFYNYSAADNMAVVMEFDGMGQDMAPTPFILMDEIVVDDSEFVATELVAGVDSGLWITSDGAGNEVKVWVHPEYHIPVRVEIKLSTGETMIMEYTNIQVGEISDEEFAIPKNVTIINPFNLKLE